MTDDEREEYIQGLSEQERLWLLILDALTRLHVEVSRLDRRLLKVLEALKDTSIIDAGTEAVHEELAVPFFPVGYRGVAHTAQESYHLDRVAAFLYMGEPEKPKRKKRRTRSTRSGRRRRTRRKADKPHGPASASIAEQRFDGLDAEASTSAIRSATALGSKAAMTS